MESQSLSRELPDDSKHHLSPWLRDLAYVAIGLLLPAIGCTNHPVPTAHETEGHQAILISQNQAEAIAEHIVGRGTNHVEISKATLVRDSFWRVVVESGAKGQNSFTNFFPSSFSAKDAEQVSSEVAKETIGADEYSVQPAELLRGWYWLVVVWSAPSSPGGYTMLAISAEDGSIVRTYPSM